MHELNMEVTKQTKKKKKTSKINQFKLSIKFYDHHKILVPNCEELLIKELIAEAEKRYKKWSFCQKRLIRSVKNIDPRDVKRKPLKSITEDRLHRGSNSGKL